MSAGNGQASPDVRVDRLRARLAGIELRALTAGVDVDLPVVVCRLALVAGLLGRRAVTGPVMLDAERLLSRVTAALDNLEAGDR